MRQALGLLCCALLLVAHPIGAAAKQAPGAQTQTTVTATIEAIDKANRTVTLKGAKGPSTEINVPDQMEGFNSLKVGDQVTATYLQAVALNIRKPGDPAPSAAPATTTVRKEGKPGSETRRQQTFTVTVQAIAPKGSSVTVKGPQGREVTLAVSDPAQVQNLKPGDTVDVTYYESLLVKVSRPKK
jgi:Cu/Ag efflux protein CusF